MAEKSKRGVGAVGCLWKQLSLQGTAARLGGGGGGAGGQGWKTPDKKEKRSITEEEGTA